MPEKQETKKKKTEPGAEESILVTAARAIGTAAGKVAALASTPSPAKEKAGKLHPKNKTRLPRLQKKALRKVTARKAKSLDRT